MGNQNFDFKKLPNGTLVAVKKEKPATKSEKAPPYEGLGIGVLRKCWYCQTSFCIGVHSLLCNY